MNRRSFFTGVGASVLAAPAVVRAASLMPIRGIVMPLPPLEYSFAQMKEVLAANIIKGPIYLLDPLWKPLSFEGVAP